MKKRTLQISISVIVALVVAVCLWLFLSADEVLQHRVVVLRSLPQGSHALSNDDLSALDEYDRRGYNARISHLFVEDFRRPAELVASESLIAFRDSLLSLRPDVIVLEGDESLNFAMQAYDSLGISTPTVFFDVNMPDSLALLHHATHVTGFVHLINFRENIEFLHRVKRSRSVYVEIDNTNVDVRLRNLLTFNVKDTSRYVLNDRLRLGPRPHVSERSGKIAVTMFSVADPSVNCTPDESLVVGMWNTDMIYRNVASQDFLFVKHDLFSDAVLDRCAVPQMSCVNDRFAYSDEPRVLGGNFPLRSAQIREVVGYVIRIFNGESPNSLPISSHVSGNYLDYRAMRLAGLSYDDWKDVEDVTIVRVPWSLRHRLLFFSLVALAVLSFVAIITACLMVLTSRSLVTPGVKARLRREVSKRNLLLDCNDIGIWRMMFNAGVFCISSRFAESLGMPRNSFSLSQMRRSLMPGSLSAFNSMSKVTVDDGVQKVRLQMRTGGEEDIHWWEFRFFRTVDGDLLGIIISVDSLKRAEDDLRLAQVQIAETEIKESFLASISHDIRTPLGAVTGFAELLTTQFDSLSAEDRLSMKQLIRSNADMMLKLIDDVLSLKNFTLADFRFDCRPSSVKQLIEVVFESNKIVAPVHLDFRCVTPSPDCKINVDPKRTEQILNNFLSNAFKFTSSGKVEVGGVLLPDGRLELYVEDTGKGLTEEGLQKLWDRYYTQDSKNRGFGLGLDICRTFAEMMNAEIGVDSEFGSGSRFYCRFAVVNGKEAAHA